MKHSILKKLSLALASGALSLAACFSAMAATPVGTLEGADSSSIYGWVWDSDSYGHVIPVEISVYPTDSQTVLKTASVKADHYQEKLQESIGDGYHGFKCSMDWDQFEQDQLRVTAYAVTEEERVFLGELTYHKDSEDFVLAADRSQDAESQEASAAKDADDVSPAPQGPGDISVSRQAPKTSGSLRDTGKGSGSTVAVGQAPKSSQDTPKASGSNAFPAQDTAVSQDGPNASGPDSSQKQDSADSQNALKASDNAGDPASSGSKASDNAGDQASSDSKASDNHKDASSDKVLLPWQKGPGFAPKKEVKPEPVPVSKGMFTITGYCSCDICCPSSVSNLTYSGTEPQPEHTVSADIDIFPIGARLMIDGIIYTVEDIGSNVIENKIDIFYATHEEALAHGTTTEEVFYIPE